MSHLGPFNPPTFEGGSTDNKFKFINFGIATPDLVLGQLGVAKTINNLDLNSELLTVSEEQIPVFFGVVFPADKSPENFKGFYVVNGKGKGTYGLNGTVTLTANDLERIEKEDTQDATENGGGFDGGLIEIIQNDPNAHVENLGEIGTENILDHLNANHTFVIGAKTWYFDLTRNGKRLFYIFTGNPGTYGFSATPFTTENTYLMFTEAMPNSGKIEIEGISFDYRPTLTNDGGYPMPGDIALNNFENNGVFAKTLVLGSGDPFLFASWEKIGENLSEFSDDIGAAEAEIIKVTDKAQLVNIDLDETKYYYLLRSIQLTATERIRVNNLQLLFGLGADNIVIHTSEDNSVIFEGQDVKDVNIKNIALSPKGIGSKAFNIKNLEGNQEFRLEGVNFIGATDCGIIDGFRQWFTKDIGFYGCKNGFELRGSWDGMYFQEANAFNFDAGGTLFRQGAGLSFTGRCLIQLNFSFPLGAKLLDFMPSVFLDDEALQLTDCVAKVDGLKNDANALTLIPNISANSPKSLWTSNNGLPNTAIQKIVIDNDVSGTYVIDWLNDTYDLTLTADTLFTEINLPASGRRTKTLNITIDGDFTPTFPANWEINKTGTFKTGEVNDISIKFISANKYVLAIRNTLTNYPAPALGTVVPAGLLPDTTAALILNGSFLTPASIVTIVGQTVNSIEFNRDTGALELSVTTGSIEGDFDIFVSNGTGVTFQNKLTIALGEVFIPSESDWNIVQGTPNLSEDGAVSIDQYNVLSIVEWSQIFDKNKDWSLRFTPKNSALGDLISGPASIELELYDPITNDVKFWFGLYFRGGNSMRVLSYSTDTSSAGFSRGRYDGLSSSQEFFDLISDDYLEFRYISGNMFFYRTQGVLEEQFPDLVNTDLKLRLKNNSYNFFKIKYIELAN